MPAVAADARGDFVRAMRAAAEQAGRASGGFEQRRFRIAGRIVEFRIAGSALAEPLTAALEHARTEGPGPPSLTVTAWDFESTGTAAPLPPWGPEDYREHGIVRGWFDDDLRVFWQWASDALTVHVPAEREALYWSASGFSPYFERAGPLRKLLNLWLAEEGLCATHAAAVGDERGCVLLAGRSGAGKSSAALACLGSELGLIADDYCVLDLEGDGAPTVHALYSSAKANDDTMARLGLNAAMVDNPVREPGDKGVLFLARHRPADLRLRGSLRAILVPAITGERETRAVPESPAAAMAALGPSTMLQLPGNGPATLRTLGRVARAVPCYRLEVGTDPAGVPAAIAGILSS